MSYVSNGPVSSLPGSRHNVSSSSMCDTHPDKFATIRIQGETDSMGAEFIDMCQECFDKYQKRDRSAESTGCCDWCNKAATDLRPRRDVEEGMCGPVYQVCRACVRRENERYADEVNDDMDIFSHYEAMAELDED